MTAFRLERCEAALGRPLARLAAAAVVAGATAFVLGALLGQARPAFASLAASWLFCAGLAAGGVALAAAVRIAHGRWAAPILPIAEASTGFFAPALALLAVLVLGARLFIPWGAEASAGRQVALVARLLLASGILFALGARLVARARAGEAADRLRARAVVYIVAYAVVLSLWAFDLVMALSVGPPSTVVPAYYFLGAFLSALAWVALVAALRDVSGPDLRHDLGKLLFAFIVVWSYLLWALFLPTWYGNIPEEAAPLLARWRPPFRPVTAFVLIAVFAWPFWLLFSEKLKRRRATLATGAATILLGLLCERFLLVLPSLHLPGGAASLLVGLGVTLGVLGLFLLSVSTRLPPRHARGGRHAPGGGRCCLAVRTALTSTLARPNRP
jgi:hypothetical protein